MTTVLTYTVMKTSDPTVLIFTEIPSRFNVALLNHVIFSLKKPKVITHSPCLDPTFLDSIALLFFYKTFLLVSHEQYPSFQKKCQNVNVKSESSDTWCIPISYSYIPVVILSFYSYHPFVTQEIMKEFSRLGLLIKVSSTSFLILWTNRETFFRFCIT